MGSDLAVANAARVSFNKESSLEVIGYEEEVDYEARSVTSWPIYKLRDNDAKLINYLAKHNHWSPFAHTSISLRMSAPVPIRTQC